MGPVLGMLMEAPASSLGEGALSEMAMALEPGASGLAARASCPPVTQSGYG